ncbi:C4-dicarboxylate transporter DctA [Brachybacterium endophyticum]|uniref:C4-dicarboxylate transporter DctA n=1 Tax=Brachybacterium endophyticum TaxID=2182385 RepID=A0A2U2RIJ4_9MICO|nr:cation:dicarboxylase symporter family transporter [Brachybacterium endophyticum]PWH05707.1 C4-dicarboxylate transporter DctA [Brachybacterium endophyticum]
MPAPSPTQAAGPDAPRRTRRVSPHLLYILVIIAVLAGIAFGLIAPDTAAGFKVLGDLFVNLIKMMIAPIIFCTIVLGIGSVRSAATVGRIGILALVYFLIMSTFALAIGLVVGNILKPGQGLTIPDGGSTVEQYVDEAEAAGGLMDFIGSIIPKTMVSSLTDGSVLQALLIALLVGFAVQGIGGRTADVALEGIEVARRIVFRVLMMVLWLAPIGAFGAMAAVVGASGIGAVWELIKLMIGFYITCILFVVGVLGIILYAVARVNVFQLLKYLIKEIILIIATSSSESALPLLMAKMEHLGVKKSTVGIVVPTGYSFNLDGTAIYLTMAAIFVSDAMRMPMTIPQQIGLLVFMIVASKGAAGVSGAGLATLAGGLAAHRSDLLPGVGIIIGIDRFMSEARAITNFAGNAIATVVIGTMTRTIDRDRAREVLSGNLPFVSADAIDGDGTDAAGTDGAGTDGAGTDAAGAEHAGTSVGAAGTSDGSTAHGHDAADSDAPTRGF